MYKATLPANYSVQASTPTHYLQQYAQYSVPGYPVQASTPAHHLQQYAQYSMPGYHPAQASTSAHHLQQYAQYSVPGYPAQPSTPTHYLQQYAQYSVPDYPAQPSTIIPSTIQEEQLLKFLKLVADSEILETEEMLIHTPILASMSSNVTDHAGREFKNITAFQYAGWALDWNMCKMLRKYMLPEEATKQVAEMKDGSWVQEYGTYANWQQLIDLLNNYDSLNIDQRKLYWCQQIGRAQRNLPAHVIRSVYHNELSKWFGDESHVLGEHFAWEGNILCEIGPEKYQSKAPESARTETYTYHGPCQCWDFRYWDNYLGACSLCSEGTTKVDNIPATAAEYSYYLNKSHTCSIEEVKFQGRINDLDRQLSGVTYNDFRKVYRSANQLHKEIALYGEFERDYLDKKEIEQKKIIEQHQLQIRQQKQQQEEHEEAIRKQHWKATHPIKNFFGGYEQPWNSAKYRLKHGF